MTHIANYPTKKAFKQAWENSQKRSPVDGVSFGRIVYSAGAITVSGRNARPNRF